MKNCSWSFNVCRVDDNSGIETHWRLGSFICKHCLHSSRLCLTVSCKIKLQQRHPETYIPQVLKHFLLRMDGLSSGILTSLGHRLHKTEKHEGIVGAMQMS